MATYGIRGTVSARELETGRILLRSPGWKDDGDGLDSRQFGEYPLGGDSGEALQFQFLNGYPCRFFFPFADDLVDIITGRREAASLGAAGGLTDYGKHGGGWQSPTPKGTGGLNLGTDLATPLASGFTFCTWFRFRGNDPSEDSYIGHAQRLSDTGGWMLWSSMYGGLGFDLYSDAGVTPIISLSVSAGTVFDFAMMYDWWCHLGVSAKTAGGVLTARIYLNGRIVAEDTAAAPVGYDDSDGEVWLNHEYGYGRSVYEDPALFSMQMSEVQIKEIMRRGDPATGLLAMADLVGYWPLCGTVADFSGVDADAVPSGSLGVDVAPFPYQALAAKTQVTGDNLVIPAGGGAENLFRTGSTVSFWFRFHDRATPISIFSKLWGEFWMTTLSGSLREFHFGWQSAKIGGTWQTTVVGDTWIHVTVMADSSAPGGEPRLFLDGVEITPSSSYIDSTPISAEDNPLTLLSAAAVPDYLYACQVAIFDRLLSDGEVAALPTIDHDTEPITEIEDCILYLPFANHAYDASFGGNNATLYGSCAWSSGGAVGHGRNGTFLKATGNTDYAKVLNFAALDTLFTGGGTVSVQAYGAVGVRAVATGNWSISMSYVSAGDYRWAFTYGGGGWRVKSQATENAWAHIVVQFDDSTPGNDPLIWIDGVLQEIAVISYPNSYPATCGHLFVGQGGYFDDVALYHRTLSAAEIGLLGQLGAELL